MPRMSQRLARATAITACATHFLHDGLSDLLYVMFPVWAREFSLSFAQVGLLRTSYSGAMSLFQIPAGFLAERWGEARLLAAGTFICALGFLALGTATRFGWLLLFLLIAGLGSSVQHPLSSSLVSRAYEEGPRRMALGTYNFSGDLGKMTLPATVALVTAWVGWRWATRDAGILALAAALGILIILTNLMPQPASEKGRPAGGAAGGGWGIRDARGFSVLSAIHIIDSSTRTSLLTYLPFLLLAKGGTVETVGLALGLTFTGGAVGKFICGAVAERLGIIRTVILTEAATGLGILALLATPLRPALVMLPVLGVALNGTSSVLYGSVADLVVPERRSRAYGLFYTVGIGSGALAPTVYGFLSDWAGVPLTLTVVGLVVLVTIPLSSFLRLPLLGGSGRVS
jgi:FSR family fosmidomycin resistance protein-like MFS transporter